MQNGYGGIDTLTVFPVLYRSFFLFSEQTPVLLDAELGFVDTLGDIFVIQIAANRQYPVFQCPHSCILDALSLQESFSDRRL